MGADALEVGVVVLDEDAVDVPAISLKTRLLFRNVLIVCFFFGLYRLGALPLRVPTALSWLMRICVMVMLRRTLPTDS